MAEWLIDIFSIDLISLHVNDKPLDNDFFELSEHDWVAKYRYSKIGFFQTAYLTCDKFECRVMLDDESKILTYSIELPVSDNGFQTYADYVTKLVLMSNGYLGQVSVPGFSSFPYYSPTDGLRLVRRSNMYALPWIQWINYFSNQVIDLYGREKLMAAPWAVNESFKDRGSLLVVSTNIIDYNDERDCFGLYQILESINYRDRFWEQAE